MLKKNKALILVVISMLLVSMFAFVGCAKKGTVGKEYDSVGLPLTKSAALKLWQGEWVIPESTDIYENKIYRNDIKNNQYLVFGKVSEINSGKNLDYYRNMYAEAEITYDSKTKTLYFRRLFSGTTIENSIHFVDKNTLLEKENYSSEYIVFKRI